MKFLFYILKDLKDFLFKDRTKYRIFNQPPPGPRPSPPPAPPLPYYSHPQKPQKPKIQKMREW